MMTVDLHQLLGGLGACAAKTTDRQTQVNLWWFMDTMSEHEMFAEAVEAWANRQGYLLDDTDPCEALAATVRDNTIQGALELIGDLPSGSLADETPDNAMPIALGLVAEWYWNWYWSS